MQKIPTIFRRDPDDPRRVLPEVVPGCEWVLAGEGTPTRKYDGTCVMLDSDGRWWARREVKPGKTPPEGFQAVETDENTAKTVGWEPIERSPFAKFHAQAVPPGEDDEYRFVAGTYELCGPKVNGNPEGLDSHDLIFHLAAQTLPDAPRDYEGLAAYLLESSYEGIVWHHPDGRMAKLKRRDFARAQSPAMTGTGERDG